MREVIKSGGISMIENTDISPAAGPDWLSRGAVEPARRFLASLPGYAETPLVNMRGLARRCGVRSVLIKDETQRFGLGAFKALGGAWAVFCLCCERLGLDPAETDHASLRDEKHLSALADTVFITATDGNHGRGVAWAAGLFGCRAVIFMPRGSAQQRVDAIKAQGGSVTVTELGYDDTVRLAAKTAEENGWLLVQDTSLPGYERVPRLIAQGYAVMALEAIDELHALGLAGPSHVLLQAGVGSMAGAVLGAFEDELGPGSFTAAVAEPAEAACIFESARINDGAAHRACGSEKTIMAGLNCSEPCALIWPVLRDGTRAFFSCPDFVAAEGTRRLALPDPLDRPLFVGESAALTPGLLCALTSRPELRDMRDRLGLGFDSDVLLFVTEGVTDQPSFRAIVREGAYPYPES